MEIIEAACESAQTNRCETIRAIQSLRDKTPGVNEPAAIRESA
jgi:hypothetical protein